MNYKLFLQILLILAIITTLCICIMKPQMHKSVMVYNSEYQLVPKQQVVVEEKTLPTMPTEPEQKIIEQKVIEQPQVQTVNLEPKVIHIFKEATITPKVETKKTENKVATPQKVTMTTSTKPQVQTTTNKTNYNIDVNQIAQRAAQSAQQKPQITQTQTTTNPSTRINITTPTQTVPQTQKVETKTTTPATTTKTTTTPAKTTTATTTPPKQRVLTAEEEEIAWNIWRSNLQNKIMTDVKLPAIPHGTVFRFTFDVDKYGKITNVQTWSETSKYTPHAIQYIAPVIRSYQGRTILNFPAGSARTTTKVVGGWRISANTKLSTPQDYNDTERIKK